MIKTLLDKWFPDRQELIIRTELLPSFPKMEIDKNKVIVLAREHPSIIKVSGGKYIPLTLFDITYSYRLKYDSDGFPAWSPVTIKIVWSKIELKKYRKKLRNQKC